MKPFWLWMEKNGFGFFHENGKLFSYRLQEYWEDNLNSKMLIGYKIEYLEEKWERVAIRHILKRWQVVLYETDDKMYSFTGKPLSKVLDKAIEEVS